MTPMHFEQYIMNSFNFTCMKYEVKIDERLARARTIINVSYSNMRA